MITTQNDAGKMKSVSFTVEKLRRKSQSQMLKINFQFPISYFQFLNFIVSDWAHEINRAP